MVKPVKIHDNNLWDKFVSDSEQYFAVLSPGTKVAFFVGETDKNFLLIERTEGAIDSKFNVNELLDDASKLSNFIKEGKLGIFCLVDDVVMAEKGLDKLLNNLGFAPSCAI